jgi:hypothetical protein
MKRRALVLVIAVVAAAPCFGGGDAEFHAVVKAIEAQYGVHHLHIPFGLATFCLKVAQVPGASGLKIAVFDDLPRAQGITDETFEASVESSLAGAWHPLVRVRSKDDNQLTLIYANPSDKEIRALIVVLQPDSATVVQAKVKAAQIRKWIEEPDEVTHESD